jgi:hypothetical protein
VWQWYREMWSGESLTFAEISAWSTVAGVKLLGWEVDLIRSLDRAYWRVAHD